MLAALISLQLAASEPATMAAEPPLPSLTLDAYRVKDGDTFRDTGRGYDIQLHGVDAPEIEHAKYPAERERGEAAASRVRELLAAAEAVSYAKAYIPRDARKWPVDGFRRRLATVSIDGRDLGVTLLAEGHAKVHFGDDHHWDWCS